MKFFIQGFVVVLILGSYSGVSADELDAASGEALAKTQQLLSTPEMRAKEIEKNSNAQLVDVQVRSLAGNAANTEEMYKLSGSIFNGLAKETGGDVTKLMQIVVNAKDNPQAFYEHLSEKDRKALEDLSKKITIQPTMAREPSSQK